MEMKSMKELALVGCLVLGVVGNAWARQAAPGQGAPKAVAGKAADSTVAFVSADATKKTVTIKTDAGEQKTYPVEGTADLVVYQITTITKGLVKPGDKLNVVYRDNAKGAHEAVTEIRTVAATQKPN
jgi:hypothetical protein